MSENVLIRSAKENDIPALLNLTSAFSKAMGGAENPMTAERVKENFLDPKSGLDVLVAELNSQVVGYVLHHVSFETMEGAKGRYISDLFVSPDVRKSGIGTKLISAVAETCQAEGGAYLWWIAKGNTKSLQSFYSGIANYSEGLTAYAATHEHFLRLTGSQGK